MPDIATTDLTKLQTWFTQHVTLEGQPYTLDLDQVRAVADLHQNTLVTARAGSGKTRVIVAKIAYLLARCGYQPNELATFMFNRTAAAEVNARIAAVCVDNRPIVSENCEIASTFHKFALDLIKLAKIPVCIISEADQATFIERALRQYYQQHGLKIKHQVFLETLQLVQSFVTRAGQKYPGIDGLAVLEHDMKQYCQQWATEQKALLTQHADDQLLRRRIATHRVALAVYRAYLRYLQAPRTDFNLLMAQATQLLYKLARANRAANSPLAARVQPLRYLLVDEYQDFSYLFFSLVQGIRAVSPAAHLFAVGDDWQAINRFAGSDCDYFLKFADFFPDDTEEIPLATNYRSDRRIVENANEYMLTHYNPQALPARAFKRQRGKIRYVNPSKIRFDRTDLAEDALGDGRFLQALASSSASASQVPTGAAQLLKSLSVILCKHRYDQVMLLHRHNFTSFNNLTLEQLMRSLQEILVAQGVHTPESFAKQVRCLTMHKSKGLEADVVILLEMNRDLILGSHPHAQMFPIFGDTKENERADQQRLLYVALSRPKHLLYLLSTDSDPPL